MSDKNKIALIGQAGTGKDTVADILIKHRGFVKLALADKLKEVVSQVYGFPLEWCYTPEGKNTFLPQWGCTVRHLLQFMGTEGFRNASPPFTYGVWIVYTHNRVINEHIDKVIITDCRMINEGAYFYHYNYTTNRIWRGDGAEANINSQHQSEREVYSEGMKPYVINELYNNGTLEELESKVLTWWDAL